MAHITISGGNKWRGHLERLFAKRVEVRAGVLEGATNEEAAREGRESRVAVYAAYNEFGAKNIPARPFMRQTVAEQMPTWKQNVARALPRMGMDATAKVIGQRMAEDIQAKILSDMPPPNAPATLRRKAEKEGPRGTLVDTGTLAKAISYEVK